MKNIKLSPVLAATVAVAVQINHDKAFATPPPSDFVTYTNETAYGSEDVSISFPTILNADELVSISEGTATGYESGTFDLDVEYSPSGQTQLYSSSSSSINLDTIINKTFTEGDIDGLTFTLPEGDVSIPVGTVFTFEVVPEPSTVALAALGAGGLWLAARRRTAKQH